MPESKPSIVFIAPSLRLYNNGLPKVPSAVMRFVRPLSLAAWLLMFLSPWVPELRADSVSSLGSPSYRLRQWTTEQGLPNNSVTCLLQTRDGYLWAGTMFGLARFDGFTFRVLDQANLPAFRNGSDAVNALVEDTEGALWVGTANGLVRNQAGRFTRFTRADGLPHDTVLSLAPSKSGGIWIGTHSGIVLYKHGRFVQDKRWEPLRTNNISALAEGNDGRLWIAHKHGVSKWLPGGDLVLTNEFGADSALFTDHSGKVWLAARPSGRIFCLSNDHVTRWQLPPNLPATSVVTAFFEDRSHRLHAVVRDGGMLALGPGGFEAVSGPSFPEETKVHCAVPDAEGNLWLGTHHGGLLRLQKCSVQTYTSPGGSDWNQILSVFGTPDGIIWAGTDRGVLKLENGQLTPVTYKEYPNWKMSVPAVFMDRQQQVWAAPRGAGLVRLQEGQFIRINPTGSATFPKNLSFEAIYQDPEDTLWLGSGAGLWRLSSGQWSRFGQKEGLPDLDIRCILRDSSGKLWLGTHGGGLNFFYKGAFQNFSEKDGLPHLQVHCLYEDSQRTLWVGTQLGLARFKKDRFQTISTRQGLFDNCVNHIEEDDAGRLWIGCNRGIYSVLRSQLNGVADGSLAQVNCVVYGEADGMLSNETNGEHQPSGWKGPDGRLWFPTQKGLAVVDPKAPRDEEQMVRVGIERVRANGKTVFDVLPLLYEESPVSSNGTEAAPVQASDGLWNFPSQIRQSLEFHYGANSFTAPERIKYRYKMDGYENEWHEAGPQRLAVYTNLRPGKYRFQVSACNQHGLWNNQTAVFGFSIAPHFTETNSFYGLCALAVMLAAWGIHHYRVGVVRQMQELTAQAALSEQRARIARDMHDDLGANLSKIALINEVVRRNIGNPQVLQSETGKIANIASQTVDGLSELVWAANPKYDTIDTLFSYLREYAGQFFEETSIRCQLFINPPAFRGQVDFKLRRHLFLVVKEALHNILKHSRASTAEVRITAEPGAITISIADNGIGLNARGPAASGNGLSNMRQRIHECNGTFDIQSPDNLGTSLLIRVPLPP